MVYEAAAPNAQSCTPKIEELDFYLGMFCGNTLMDIFTQTWFVLYLLFSEMKHWAYLYINSLLIRDLFLLSCVDMIFVTIRHTF